MKYEYWAIVIFVLILGTGFRQAMERSNRPTPNNTPSVLYSQPPVFLPFDSSTISEEAAKRILRGY